jgi:hypothetical protein
MTGFTRATITEVIDVPEILTQKHRLNSIWILFGSLLAMMVIAACGSMSKDLQSVFAALVFYLILFGMAAESIRILEVTGHYASKEELT